MSLSINCHALKTKKTGHCSCAPYISHTIIPTTFRKNKKGCKIILKVIKSKYLLVLYLNFQQKTRIIYSYVRPATSSRDPGPVATPTQHGRRLHLFFYPHICNS